MEENEKFPQSDSDEDNELKFDAKIALKDAESINFSDSRESKAFSFECQYKEYLVKPKNFSKIVHALAEDKAWSEKQISGFLEWMLATFKTSTTTPDLFRCLHVDTSNTPLLTALKKKNGKFVRVLLDMASNEKNAIKEEQFRDPLTRQDNPSVKDKKTTPTSLMGMVLTATGSDQYNCLHMAVLYKSEVFNQLVGKCNDYPNLFVQGDKDGDTPLHLAVSQFDDSHKLIFKEGQVQFLKPLRIDTVNRPEHGRRDGMQVNTPSSVPLSRTDNLDDTTITSPWTFTFYDAVKLLLRHKHGQKALVKNNISSKDTPYQSRLRKLAKKLRQENGKIDEIFIRDAEILEPMADYIRSLCIQELDRDDLMKALYKPGEEREIEFDLCGTPSPSISRAYLERLTEHLRFECILKYVKLPGLRVEAFKMVSSIGANVGEQQSNQIGKESSARNQIESVHTIFDWLRQNKVRRILKVEVIDDDDQAHSDEAIENSVAGMGIEEWDWRKLDLCSDVIASSTNVVRKISLFSSGNTAVLMGWSSSDGFLNTKKFPKLQSVKLFIREGNKESKRLDKHISEFKMKLRKSRNITVAYGPNRTSPSISSFLNFDGNDQLESDWMACSTMFAKFINTIPKTKTDPIKFAIIDDGIDNSLGIFAGKIARGQSFCPYPNSTHLRNSYFCPSSSHGTVMASLICKICPRASLYIARLEERFTTQGRRIIGSQSAAKAVQWAVDCGVDIISMSWSIEVPDSEGFSKVEPLHIAIEAAVKKNILMFCSASDQGSSSNNRCFPGAWGQSFQIGASTETGEPFSWVHGQSIDFLLPGEITFNDHDPSTYPSRMSSAYRSGSSIATAVASGLAGLILHCQEILEGKESEDYKQFKTRLGMEGAFQKMAGGRKEKFPQINSFFEAAKFGHKDWLIQSKEAETNLASMMKKIQGKT